MVLETRYLFVSSIKFPQFNFAPFRNSTVYISSALYSEVSISLNSSRLGTRRDFCGGSGSPGEPTGSGNRGVSCCEVFARRWLVNPPWPSSAASGFTKGRARPSLKHDGSPLESISRREETRTRRPRIMSSRRPCTCRPSSSQDRQRTP